MKNIKIDSLLHENGFKVTPSRVAILKFFSDTCNPLRADDIFENISPKIDRVTVYRTLASFEEKGIIRRVNLHKDSAYFEFNNDHHHHIVCINCGKIEKFKKCVADFFLTSASKSSKKFSEIKSHSLELFGICKSCAASK